MSRGPSRSRAFRDAGVEVSSPTGSKQVGGGHNDWLRRISSRTSLPGRPGESVTNMLGYEIGTVSGDPADGYIQNTLVLHDLGLWVGQVSGAATFADPVVGPVELTLTQDFTVLLTSADFPDGLTGSLTPVQCGPPVVFRVAASSVPTTITFVLASSTNAWTGAFINADAYRLPGDLT